MDDLGAATEDQVILAWLQAEIESPDFQAYVIGNPPNPANLSLALKLTGSARGRAASRASGRISGGDAFASTPMR